MVLFETVSDVVQLIYLSLNLFFLAFKNSLKVLSIFFFFSTDQRLKFLEFLGYQLLMYLVRLLYPALVSLAYGYILVNVFQSPFGLSFEITVLFRDTAHGITDGTDTMILLLFHVTVHALHAHH